MDNRMWKGIAAGAIGGVVGSLLMNVWQKALAQSVENQPPQPSPQGLRDGAGNRGVDPTVKMADAVSRRIMHRGLRPKEAESAGVAIHYAFGAAVGALFGAAAEFEPALAAGAGIPFGAAVWAGADLIALPALHLSKPPMHVPLRRHAQMLALHAAYGATLDGVRRALRAAMVG